MAAPNEGFDYKSVEQRLNFNGGKAIVFQFYDHSMCGAGLLMVSICEQSQDPDYDSIYLCSEGPVEDGTPSLFPIEAFHMLRLSYFYDKDNCDNKDTILTIPQRYSLLLRLCSHLVKYKSEIETEFDVNLSYPAWNETPNCPTIRGDVDCDFDLNDAFPMTFQATYNEGYSSKVLNEPQEVFIDKELGIFTTNDTMWIDGYRHEDNCWMESHGQDFFDFLEESRLNQAIHGSKTKKSARSIRPTTDDSLASPKKKAKHA